MTPTQAAEQLERAKRLERGARGDEALDLLAECESWPSPFNEGAVVLRAILLGMRDPIAALDSLPDSIDAFTTPESRFGYLSACGRAYIKTRNLRESEKLLEAARREVRGDDDPNRYELAFWSAYLRWNRREYDPASPDLLLAVQAPDPAVRILALNLQAWMHGGLEDHRALLDGLIASLNVFDEYGERCSLRCAACSLQSAADLAWEMLDMQAARRTHDVFHRISWTPELRMQRFGVARSIAWHAFLSGDTVNGNRLFAQAKALAFTRAWEVTPAVDAAYVAWLTDDEEGTLAELREAQTIADSVDWEATRGDERMALISLAVLLAPYDLDAAERYLDLHHRLLPQSLLERLDNAHEPRRLQAYRKYADGQIAAVRGNKTLAIRLFSDAHDIFRRIGFLFRAALAARSLWTLTGDQTWLEMAQQHAASHDFV